MAFSNRLEQAQRALWAWLIGRWRTVRAWWSRMPAAVRRRMLLSWLGLLIIAVVVVRIFLFPTELQMTFTELDLHDVPELRERSSDFVFDLDAFEIDGTTAKHLSLSEADHGQTCRDVVLVPVKARNGGRARLAIGVRGDGCSTRIDWLGHGKLEGSTHLPGDRELSIRTPRPPAKGPGSRPLLAHSRAANLMGQLVDVVGLSGSDRLCRQGHVTDLSGRFGGMVRVREVRWNAEQGTLTAWIWWHVYDHARIDGEPCEMIFARKLIWDHLKDVFNVIGVLLGIGLGVTWRRPSNTAVVASLAGLVLLGASPTHAQSRRRVLVVPAWTACNSATRADDQLLALVAASSANKIATALREATSGAPQVDVLPRPSSVELLAALKAATQPLWLVYIGHGWLHSGRSVICLRDRDVTIDELADSVPASASASLWFDGCESSAVHTARASTSLFAASGLPTQSGVSDTPIGAAIADAVRAHTLAGSGPRTDVNCDGIVTDEELFEAVRVRLRPQGKDPPRPRLRKSWSPLPLVDIRAETHGCTAPASLDALKADHPQLAPLLAAESAYRGSGMLPCARPPVLWLASTQAAAKSLSGATHALRVESTTEAAGLAAALLLPRVLELQIDSEVWSIVDVRRPGVPPLMHGSRLADLPAIDEGLEAKLLNEPPQPEAPSAGERLRYTRPVSSEEREALRQRGFSPCGCASQLGHCFCNRPLVLRDRRGARK